MLALKSRRTLRARVALNSIGMSCTYIHAHTKCPSQKAVVEGPEHDGGTALRHCRKPSGQGGEEHPLFRGGSLHGSAHPNSLHSLDPGIPGGSLPPPVFRTYSQKLGIVDTESMVHVSQLRRDGNSQQAARVSTFVLVLASIVIFSILIIMNLKRRERNMLKICVY